MGEVISLEEHRRARAVATPTMPVGGSAPRATVSFAFDVASPWTYLAAERVDRAFPGAAWQPVAADAVHAADRRGSELSAVEARAADLGMPLVWPEDAGAGRIAARVASWAAEQGQAPAFVLAAGRLAFCGGFDLDEPEILAEAAAAAGLGLDGCLAAAGDRSRDAVLADAGRKLRAEGADHLPAVRVGRLLFSGEHRLADAAAALRDPQVERGRSSRGGRAS